MAKNKIQKYVAVYWEGVMTLKPELVDRESDLCVYIDGHQKRKRTAYYNYFDSWQEARQFLIDQAKAEILKAEFDLKNARARFGKAKAMNEEGMEWPN